MWIIDSYLILALLSGFGVAIMAGILGCFVVWRRMAYFGDSLAHIALLGIALGLIYNISHNLAILFTCSCFAILLVLLEQTKKLGNDTLLGIFAHSGLAVGLLTISLVDSTNFHLHSLLFGDILAVNWEDIYWILGCGFIVVTGLIWQWPHFILMTLNEDLARAEGVNTFQSKLILMGFMTLVVTVSIHVVGILLITSLLIIPAAAARQLANSPTTMALLSVLIGCISVTAGLCLSLYLDVPTGPAIVTCASLLFSITFIKSLVRGS